MVTKHRSNAPNSTTTRILSVQVLRLVPLNSGTWKLPNVSSDFCNKMCYLLIITCMHYFWHQLTLLLITVIRTLTGHKTNVRCLDFHPYGHFLASGSFDTSIKLWDYRNKGCIFTYKVCANHYFLVKSILIYDFHLGSYQRCPLS